MTTNESPVPTTSEDNWEAQFTQLKARYPKVREPILVALHILAQNPDIDPDDAKAQAELRGVRITLASINAARRLLSRRDGAPTTAPTPARAPRNGTIAANKPQPRRPRATRPEFDAEAQIRGIVTKIQDQSAAEIERLHDAMRKAVAVLEYALQT